MAVPPTKVTQLLGGAIDEAAPPAHQPSDFDGWKERARTALRLTFGEGDQVIARFDDIRYGLSIWSPSTPDAAWVAARRSGVKEPDDVAVDVGQFHPWVSGMATSLWEGGQHRIAVQEAARSVEVQLRVKLGLNGGTGAPLVTEAFSTRPPTPASPRLRFIEHAEASDSWANAHEVSRRLSQSSTSGRLTRRPMIAAASWSLASTKWA